jgi:hypothetical protein
LGLYERFCGLQQVNAVVVNVAPVGTAAGCGAGFLRRSRGCRLAHPRDSLTAVLAKLHFDGSARGLFAVWSAVIVVTVVSVVLVFHVFEVRNLVILRVVVIAGLMFRFCQLDFLHLDSAVGVALSFSGLVVSPTVFARAVLVTLATLAMLVALPALVALVTLVSWIRLVASAAAVT